MLNDPPSFVLGIRSGSTVLTHFQLRKLPGAKTFKKTNRYLLPFPNPDDSNPRHPDKLIRHFRRVRHQKTTNPKPCLDRLSCHSIRHDPSVGFPPTSMGKRARCELKDALSVPKAIGKRARCGQVEDLCRCPITRTWMRNPVITSCGHTFEEDAIDRWMGLGHTTCPTCRTACLSHPFVPNYLARDLVSQAHHTDAGGVVSFPTGRKNGKMHVSVRSKVGSLRFILNPTTKLSRLVRACRSFFGTDVRVSFGGSTIGDDRCTTARSIGLVDGSVLHAA